MAKVLVGLWSRETHAPREMLSDTVHPLTEAVKRTREMAALRGLKPVKGKLKSIFVAPEFLFRSRKREAPQSTGLKPRQKDWVLKKFEKLAQDSPSMLLIPGSIVFKVPLTPLKVQRAIVNLEHAIKPIQLIEGKEGKPSKPINPYATKEAEVIGLAPEQYYRSQIEELEQYEQNLIAKMPTAMKHSFLIKNRTYVYFDGEKMFSYGKKCNMGDYDGDQEKGIFVPGKKEGIGIIDGLKVGIEICFDHELGMLSKHMNSKDLDLHIIASAEVPNQHPHRATKVGGYTLHASANPVFSKVARRVKSDSATNPLVNETIEKWRDTGEVGGKVKGSNMIPDKYTYERGDMEKTSAGREHPDFIRMVDVREFKDWDVIQPLETVNVDSGHLAFYEIELAEPTIVPQSSKPGVTSSQPGPTGGPVRGAIRGGRGGRGT